MSETRQIFQCHTLSKYLSSKWEEDKTDEKKKKTKKIQKEEKRGKYFLTIVAKGPGVGRCNSQLPIWCQDPKSGRTGFFFKYIIFNSAQCYMCRGFIYTWFHGSRWSPCTSLLVEYSVRPRTSDLCRGMYSCLCWESKPYSMLDMASQSDMLSSRLCR